MPKNKKQPNKFRNKYRIESTRLKDWDYSKDGAYFVTICAEKRKCLFGNIVNNQICLNKIGKIVFNEWIKTPLIRRNVKLDSFVVMPNHFHGVIVIGNGDLQNRNVETTRDVETTRRVVSTFNTSHGRPNGPVAGSVGAIVGQFKSVVTKRINQLRTIPRIPIWQCNYYEHIIRNENDLTRIRRYIQDNPINWDADRNNPKNFNTKIDVGYI